jgi:DNA (cytosine-5)-methyltransferase 1
MAGGSVIRPKLLDLFCCEGGAGYGYHLAGFDVTGVDIEPRPLYPFRFIQADAIDALEHWDLSLFAAIHASPPCQHFTTMSNRHRGKGSKADEQPDLLTPALTLLRRLAVPWVVENVPPAKRVMQATLTLHGGMFGLGVHRPRIFESNVLILTPTARQAANPVGVYGKAPDGRRLWSGKDYVQRAARSVEEARELMGMPWASWHGCKEAIPPAYTEYIGARLLEHIAADRGRAA